MLIDEFLSDYDFVETHGISIRAEPAVIYRVANQIDFSQSPLIRALFWLRGLSTESVTLESLKRSRFEILGETPGRELLLGIVGKFWTLHGDMQKIDADTFRKFNSAGYAKAVWNFVVRPEHGKTRLTTETRIKCTDPESRTRFGLYWLLIRPFSGLIRMEILRLIKNRAENV